MSKTSILSDFQKKTLKLFKDSPLVKQYYLTGGTALAEYYLGHRKSEDLDFFTQEEISLPDLKKFAGKVTNAVACDKLEYQHGFGLYAFFFYPKSEVAKYKIDFGQYPFGPIEPLKYFDGLPVESMYDIAVNKAHTISIRPRLRDFIDIYFILQNRREWHFRELVKKGQEKFEIVVDPLQLGENLISVSKMQDMPIMLKKIDLKALKEYFYLQARQLKSEIFSKN